MRAYSERALNRDESAVWLLSAVRLEFNLGPAVHGTMRPVLPCLL